MTDCPHCGKAIDNCEFEDGRPNAYEWIRRYDMGLYEKPDFDTQVSAGWYDWFCKESSLKSKTKKMAPQVKKMINILGMDFATKHYIWFKNNCPCDGDLYDDFRFANGKTGDTVLTIVPKSGFIKDEKRAEMWGVANNFNGPLVTGKMEDIYDFVRKNKDMMTIRGSLSGKEVLKAGT